MIRFFKNVRQKLAAENKVMAYLRYAIGEILLVVIGILIALQVNNWNENRKSEKQEKTFFSDILNDFEKDDTNLSYLKEFHLKRINYLDTLLTYVRNPKKNMGIEKFGMYVEPLYYAEDAINYSTTFESAKTSSAFNNFQQKDLIKKLTKYYADFNRLESNLASIKAIIGNQLEPLMYSISEGYLNEKSGTLVISENSTKDFYKNVDNIKDNRNIQVDYKSILENPRFESYLIGDLGRSFNSIAKIEARQNRISEIEKEIKKYINDKSNL